MNIVLPCLFIYIIKIQLFICRIVLAAVSRIVYCSLLMSILRELDYSAWEIVVAGYC